MLNTSILSPKELFQKDIRYTVPAFQRRLCLDAGRPVGTSLGGREKYCRRLSGEARSFERR